MLILETDVKAHAHAKQTEVIADDSYPYACCTEHVNRGTFAVWSDTPSDEEVARLENS